MRHCLRISGRVAVSVYAVARIGAQQGSDAVRPEAQERDQPIRCEFRIFNGEEEVTTETRVRVYPAGTKEAGMTLESSAGRLVLPVAPGIYDVQAIRHRQGQVLNIRWAERLVVMRYPDEGGQHLEVINFQSRFGALQLIGGPDAGDFDVSAFAADQQPSTAAERRAAGRLFRSEVYRLLIAPAGYYDIRLRRTSPGSTTTEAGDQWMHNVEIPADRTRLKRIDWP